MPSAIHPFERLDLELVAIAGDERLLAELGRGGIRSFTRGGCLVLAEAIAAWAGPRSTLQVIIEDGICQHVAVEFGPLWLDAAGARDRSDFEFDLEQYRFENYEIRTLEELRPTAEYPNHPTQLRREPKISERLAKRLAAAVSADDVWAAAEAMPVR